MENAELTLVIKKRILRIEDRLRGTVEAARQRIKSMADTPCDGCRSVRLEICDLTRLAWELAGLAQEAERDCAARDALRSLLHTMENAAAVARTEED